MALGAAWRGPAGPVSGAAAGPRLGGSHTLLLGTLTAESKIRLPRPIPPWQSRRWPAMAADGRGREAISAARAAQAVRCRAVARFGKLCAASPVRVVKNGRGPPHTLAERCKQNASGGVAGVAGFALRQSRASNTRAKRSQASQPRSAAPR